LVLVVFTFMGFMAFMAFMLVGFFCFMFVAFLCFTLVGFFCDDLLFTTIGNSDAGVGSHAVPVLMATDREESQRRPLCYV